jgi:predicted amino acid-binding ACT domain protein
MGIPSDDFVLIEHGNTSGEPTVVTVNCTDKAGLGCDLSRVVLEFGLYVTRGDFSTDGRWCYIVLWVTPHQKSQKVDWESLKAQLLAVCPSCLPSFYLDQLSKSSPPPVYLLKVFSADRKGLLHDVTKVLCELELTIQRVKVMTTPDDKVLDLFFITDNSMDMLHTKNRREETCDHLIHVLGEDCISCELQLAGPEYESLQGFSALSQAVAEELFNCQVSPSNKESRSASDTKSKKGATITVDNVMSPAHTLLQIQCLDQKGLVYDILRTSKDCSIQIAYGRISPSVKGERSLDLFVTKTDGKKIVENDEQVAFCSRLKEEMLHPLRLTITNRGPDMELLVANPVELSGKGRPRVFYDVTFALQTLGICIFSAEIGRHSTTSEREWEVYRFLVDDKREYPLASSKAKQDIVDRVRRTLMGW